MIGLKVTVAAAHLEVDKRALRRVIRAAGAEIRNTARQMVSGAGSGRVYRGPGGSAASYRGGYVKGRFQASSPGSPPARVTGTLARSFKLSLFRSGEGVAIRDTAFYALFLQAGAKGGGRSFRTGHSGARHYLRGGAAVGKNRVLEPRPFLSRALEQRGASLTERIGRALAAGVRLEKGPPTRKAAR